MKPRTLFSMILLSTPSLLFAQVVPEPPVPVVVSAPMAPQAPKVPSAPQAPKVPKAPNTPIAPKAPRAQGQLVNVRIDVTLADDKGVTKTLSMTVADGENAMNRTTAPGAGDDFSFNADARPTIFGNKIRLRLTADAVVPTDREGPGNRLGLRQSLTVILSDGDTLEIARATDPVSERSFVLSVKVTIQR